MKRFRLINKVAFKDIIHNRKSSFYIVLVIAAICLPMIVLFSLRDGYVIMFRDWLEKTTPAKQLGISIKMADSRMITNATIKEWNDSLNLKIVIPFIQRTGFLPRKKGADLRMDFKSTLEGDPELKRLGIQKTSDKDFGIYLPLGKSKDLLIDSLNQTIEVIFDRSGKKIAQAVPILGYINDSRNDAYLSLRLMQYYEKWTNGYGINDDTLGIHLPADDSRESALGDLLYDSVTVFKQVGFDQKLVNQIRERDITIKVSQTENLFYLGLKRDGRFSDFDLNNFESQFSSTYNAVSIPFLQMKVADTLTLTSSSSLDPKSRYILNKGSWITGNFSRFEAVIPESYLSRMAMKEFMPITIGEQKIDLLVVGTHSQKNNNIFIDYESLGRLKQLKDSKAKYDPIGEKFEPNEVLNFDDYPVTTAMVHVASLDDVLSSYQYFIRNRFDVPQNATGQIKHYLQIKDMLTKFVILLTALCGLACVLALLVLMLEIIRRKTSEIGINKVIGIDDGFINGVFISQSVIYGIGGLIFSLVCFFILSRLGESGQVNSFFDLGEDGGNIFKLSFDSILYILVLITIVSWVAGWRSTSATKNIDPADIIIRN